MATPAEDRAAGAVDDNEIRQERSKEDTSRRRCSLTASHSFSLKSLHSTEMEIQTMSMYKSHNMSMMVCVCR